MAGIAVRTGLSRMRVLMVGAAATGALVVSALAGTAPARADAVAYLVNVTVRPGYNFASPDAALGYGRQICEKVGAGVGYADHLRDIMVDFRTNDEYHGSYLINQAVNELCPNQIWQLRNSAVHYRPPAR